MITPYVIATSIAPPPGVFAIFQLGLLVTLLMFVSAVGKRFRAFLGRRKPEMPRKAKVPSYRLYAKIQGVALAAMATALCDPDVYEYLLTLDRVSRFGIGVREYRDVSSIVVPLSIASYFVLGFASLATWIDLALRNDTESEVPVAAPGA